MEEHVKEPVKLGRPWTGGPRPVRQVGRWDDESWGQIKKAAESEGKTTADWVRQILLTEAGRVRMAIANPEFTKFLEQSR